MGCGCGAAKKLAKMADKVVTSSQNLVKAVVQQPDKIKWFKDGITGLLKCAEGQTLYDDETIVKHRNICRECSHSTKENGKLTATSQCMAPDPETKAPCACFIICKTQVGTCPLEKWADLTVSILEKET